MDQPFDRLLKQFSVEGAPWLMRICRIVPPHADLRISLLEREVSGPALRTDQLFVDANRPGWIYHFEFQTVWDAGLPLRVCRYQYVIRLENPSCEVDSTVFVLRPGSCPKGGMAKFVDGRYSPVGRVRYRIVRMWELDPAPLLEAGDPKLLPFAVLMKLAPADVAALARRVAKTNDPEIESRFLALAGLRYDRKWIGKLLGEDPMFTEAVMKESWVVQDWLEKGRQEGIEKGLEQGLEARAAQEAARILRTALQSKFPGLESMIEIDQICDPAKLESLLFHSVLVSDSAEAVKAAILAAAAR